MPAASFLKILKIVLYQRLKIAAEIFSERAKDDIRKKDYIRNVNYNKIKFLSLLIRYDFRIYLMHKNRDFFFRLQAHETHDLSVLFPLYFL
jgi:hypothetical protein